MKTDGRKSEIVEAFVRENKKLNNLTIAKLLYKEYGLYFSSVESARTEVRRIRGALGVKNRPNARKDLMRTPEQSETARQNPYGLPESLSDDWKIIPFPVTKGSGLVIADMHYPFQDNMAITLALNWGKKNGHVDFILLNGDIGDFHTLSKFDKEPTAMRYRTELDGIKKILQIISRIFPNAKIIYKKGNHEYRLLRYLKLKAPEIFEMKPFLFDDYLDFKGLGVEVYENDTVLGVGKLLIGHGDEFGSISTAVSPARGLLLKTFECGLIAHNHKDSMHSKATGLDKIITTWSIGCLCTLHPQWLRFNEWTHGCAGLRVDGKDFEVENKRIFTKEGMVR
jgi:hypothetical protein